MCVKVFSFVNSSPDPGLSLTVRFLALELKRDETRNRENVDIEHKNICCELSDEGHFDRILLIQFSDSPKRGVFVGRKKSRSFWKTEKSFSLSQWRGLIALLFDIYSYSLECRFILPVSSESSLEFLMYIIDDTEIPLNVIIFFKCCLSFSIA